MTHIIAPADYRRQNGMHVDTLMNLHWLRVPQRVQFKVAVLVYKTLHESRTTLSRATDSCGRLTRSTLTSLCQCQPTRRTFRTTVDRRWPGIQCCWSTSMEQPTILCHLGRNSDSIPSQT